MKRFMASLLCVLLLAPGCVTSRTPRVQATPQGPARVADGEVLADFAGQLRIGSRVKATITGNRTIRGTLVKRTDQALVIQPRTRVAEPLVEVPFAELLALEQEARPPAGPAARSPLASASASAPRSSRSSGVGGTDSRQSTVGSRQSQSQSESSVSRRVQSTVRVDSRSSA